MNVILCLYKKGQGTKALLLLSKVSVQFSSVQLLSCVRLFVTPWTAAHQASLSITSSQSLLKLMSIELVMPSHHLILSRPLLLLPSIFPSIRVFSNESVFLIRWPKYWSFSFNVGPSIECSGLFPVLTKESELSRQLLQGQVPTSCPAVITEEARHPTQMALSILRPPK